MAQKRAGGGPERGYGLDVMDIGKVTKARKIVMNRAARL